MSELTTKKKVYLIECFFSRGKIHSNAYRGFRTKFGTHRVASENTLKRIIDNVVKYGTLQDRRHELPGPSVTVTTPEKINEVENYFKQNPNDSIRKAAQALKITESSLHNILKYFLKFHPYKISTHQLLTEHDMTKRKQTKLSVLGNGKSQHIASEVPSSTESNGMGSDFSKKDLFAIL